MAPLLATEVQMPMRTITMVKKLTADGEPCRKCQDIDARLRNDGLIDQIDEFLYMDPLLAAKDEGMMLAEKHKVQVAPFFVVRTDSGTEVVEDCYSVYMKMKREVFGKKASTAESNENVALSIF
jgi:hypothetical protein